MKRFRNRAAAFLMACALLLPACSMQIDDEEKLRDIEYTVVDPEEVPEELNAQIEEEKKDVFRLTFADEGWLYLARGYGEKDTSGYSVEVAECWESDNAVCLRTRLTGPSRDEEIAEEATWPSLVVKMEYCDKDVIFY